MRASVCFRYFRLLWQTLWTILVCLGALPLYALDDQKAETSSTGYSKPATTTRRHLIENLGKIPLGFEINQGQAEKNVRFLSRGRGYSLLLGRNEVVLGLK